MNTLESVFKYLIKKINQIVKQVETEHGTEKLIHLLSESDKKDVKDGTVAHIQEGEASPEELILLANCDLEEITEKLKIVPRINFYTEVTKIIMDTLRQNAKLLHLYNEVAQNLFEFCLKFQCKKQYKNLADVLHTHFQQLEKAKKFPEQQNFKIPYPVRLDDPESPDVQIKLLQIRRV